MRVPDAHCTHDVDDIDAPGTTVADGACLRVDGVWIDTTRRRWWCTGTGLEDITDATAVGRACPSPGETRPRAKVGDRCGHIKSGVVGRSGSTAMPG